MTFIKCVRNSNNTAYIDISKGEEGAIFKYYIHLHTTAGIHEVEGYNNTNELINEYNDIVARYDAYVDDTFNSSEFDTLVEEYNNTLVQEVVYKDYYIEPFGTDIEDGCTVCYCGDEIYFSSVDEAKEFINSLYAGA